MKKNRLISICLCLLFCTGGQSAVSGEVEMDALEKIRAADPDVRREAFMNLSLLRHRVIDETMKLMRENSSVEVKVASAKLLGEYRAVEAVEVLVQHLHIDLQPKILRGLLKEEDLYPVSRSLERIGKPSVSALLTKIMESDNAAMRDRCARICLKIEGDDATRMLIENAVARQSSAAVIERLKAVLALIGNSD